jgi:ubiquinone/menaquinone biosynthesis C-methylase UbiE
MSMSFGILDPASWDEKWKEIFDHYQHDLRHAFYIRSILEENEKKILELGAGSFRDVGALNNWGISCDGVDFSPEAVSRAKIFFPNIQEKLHLGNCFHLKFEDKVFDLSYHNGFWGCFSNDEIIDLVKEQVRVTKNRIVATVHNAHNKSFVEYFNKLKVNDPLYGLRFFYIEEIKELLYSVTKDIKIIPVGKGKKYYEDDLINNGLGSPENLKRSFEFNQLNLLEISERLMCIGNL